MGIDKNQLPPWAPEIILRKSRVTGEMEEFIRIDPDLAYPEFLKRMELPATQNSLEAARLMFTRYLKLKFGAINVFIPKAEKWALARHPEGDPVSLDKMREKLFKTQLVLK